VRHHLPNLSVNRTACKLRLQVPSGLRPPAAGYLKRWAPYSVLRLAALHLPFQVASFARSGATLRFGGLYRSSVLAAPSAQFAVARRSSFCAASVPPRSAADLKVSFSGAAPEGAESSSCGGLRSFGRGPSVRRRVRFARLCSKACAPWLAKAHSSRSRRPVPCRAACSAVLRGAWPNPAVEGTACKLRLQVPRRLRRRAAPHLER
jgi:hypothetical protein